MAKKSLYGVHPGVLMVQTWAVTPEERSGRSVDAGMKLIKKAGPTTARRRDWLEQEHGLGTNIAGWLAARTEAKWDLDNPESYRLAATRTRIDFCFALGPRKVEGRLIDTGGYAKKDRITHRIPITSLKEIDADVKAWLRIAYEEDK